MWKTIVLNGDQNSEFVVQLSRFFSARQRKLGVIRNKNGIRALRESIAQIELLESRALLSATSAIANLVAQPTIEIEHPLVTSGPTGYSPSQLQSAYGFNKLSFANGANGTGQTIAIVDAYNAPTIQNDLKAFDKAFGLADPPSLTVMSQTGSTTSLPANDPNTDKQDDWEVEESLDVEWAHALAPGAKIVLVEANSDNLSDLLAAVKTAAALPGVSVVSMSWGGGEISSESAYDSYFTTPAGHQGVTFVASTGDDGSPGGFPAYSPNVLAVGGTTLNIGASGNTVSETAWSGSGGGVSLYESQPSYQKGIVTQSTTKRTIPDVAFDADPNTGVAVYDSFSNGSATPWSQIGGTSLSAPSWGAIISIVDQGRVQNGLATLDGATQTLPMLYKLDQTNPAAFHDITSGNNGFAAQVGYDLVTGLGSPVVNVLVPGLDGAASTTSKLAFQATPATGTAGSALGTITVAIENQSGQVLTTNNSTVTLSIGSGPGGFTSTSKVSVTAVNGIATFTGLTLNTAGSYTLSAADSGMTSVTSSSITIGAAQAAKVVIQQAPTTGTVGKSLGTTTIAIEDPFGNIVTSNSTSVTLAVASGPGQFAATSTLTVAAVKGIATFSNIALTAAGSYTLRATDGTLTSATTGAISVSAPISAPQNVAISALSSTSVQLSWNAVTGTQGYRIYQINGSQSTLVGTVGSSATSVQVNGLTAGSTVSFKVEAYNGSAIADSTVVSVTLPANRLTAPVVSARVLTSNSIQLTWNSVSGAQGYRVYWSDGVNRYFLGTLRADTTSAEVDGLNGRTTYGFQVEAFQGSATQDSAWIWVNAATRQVRSSFAFDFDTPLPFQFPTAYQYRRDL